MDRSDTGAERVMENAKGHTASPSSEAATDAAHALWHAHRRWVAAILLAHKPAHAELDDLLQDVAMALVKNVTELRSQRNAKAWLRTVAINAARAAARPGRNRPMLRLAADDEHISAGPVCDALAEGDEAQRLLHLTCELPCEYSEPLLLRSVHGLSAREVASILEISEVAVHNRVSRARQMVRDRIRHVGPAGMTNSPERHAEVRRDQQSRSSSFRICDGGAA